MVSNSNDDSSEEIHDELESGAYPNAPKLREYRIRVPLFNSRSLDQQGLNHRSKRRRLLDFLKARPSIEWLKKLRLSSPLDICRQTVDEKEDISLSVPSPVGIQQHFHIHFVRKINWTSLFSICWEWLSHPMNIALLLWLICVAVAATMLGLLMLGLLNEAFPTTSLRNHWIEIINQVLNALFTLMSLYQHPYLFYHLVLLCRWRSEDIIALRKLYCKNGGYRPHEWAHMMVVVTLLHITCVAQYVDCGLYWGYSSKTRPELVENFFFALGVIAPVSAAVYIVYSPLGRQSQYDSDSDKEVQIGVSSADVKQSSKLGLNLYDRRVLVSNPEWAGGLFDCSEDVTVGYLSFFCTCCVFGWNMERLGFGNMYVHIVTFLLLCVAPFWIFNISALNIHDYVIGDTIGTAGIVLCVCGLIYGGYWRIQMRKRFKLPGNHLCCGSASLTDYFRWLFCWSCSLAQEVRTGNFYDIEGGSLYRKLMDSDEDSQPSLHPHSHDGGLSPPIRSDCCSSPLPTSCVTELPNSTPAEEGCSGSPATDVVMTPPVQPLIQLEDRVTKLEDRVSDSDTVASPFISPMMELEDRDIDDGTIIATTQFLVDTNRK